MIPDSIKHVKLKGQVWNAVVEEEKKVLYLDVRQEKDKHIQLHRLDLNHMKVDVQKVDHSWWTQLLSADGDDLYFITYEDRQDPNKQKGFCYNWESGEKRQASEPPNAQNSLTHPSIYEQGLDYHKTVAEFLALDLPLSCEYLEWNDKIIISYYLRSGNEFTRFLLLLENGTKVWKVQQDDQMKGFSPGSFFVFNDQLIFIKDRNEVCVFAC